MKKVPTQGRSRQTVDALIEATARTIAERGWPATTTNHIAARAGVSVGSLYQYFDDRADLLTALGEREQQRFLARMEEAIPRLLETDPRSGIRALLQIAFEECEREEPLFTELVRHWPNDSADEFRNRLDTYMLDALRLFLAKFYDVYKPMDAPTVSFMLTNSAVMIITRFYAARPKGVSRDKLLDEMSELYIGYFESKLRPRT
jgi:AcrR family transcriptional regulator